MTTTVGDPLLGGLVQLISDEQVTSLANLLLAKGFVEPKPGWLTSRLRAVEADYFIDQSKHDTDRLKESVLAAENQLNAIKLVSDHIAGETLWGHLLIEGILPYGAAEGAVSQADIEAARRVLVRMLHAATDDLNARTRDYEYRPEKNEQPEIDALIEGLVLIWCSALKILPSSIEISSSAGSPAMNFIQPASDMILKERSLQRETIEKRVIAIRKRMRAPTSDV